MRGAILVPLRSLGEPRTSLIIKDFFTFFPSWFLAHFQKRTSLSRIAARERVRGAMTGEHTRMDRSFCIEVRTAQTRVGQAGGVRSRLKLFRHSSASIACMYGKGGDIPATRRTIEPQIRPSIRGALAQIEVTGATLMQQIR